MTQQQEEAKEQFQSALEEFSAVVNFQGGALEKTYNKLKTELERSESKAKAVADRIIDVERVAEALFKEWDAEIEQYNSADLKRKSRDARVKTESAYLGMIRKMKAAEATMYPVLDLFRDQVLFLKHNLNARAIASLDTETSAIEAQVKKLVTEMESSIAEADAFIASMR